MNKTLITFAAGYFAALLLGMLFYRFDIFNSNSPNFQFVEAGLIGSLIYALNLYREKTEIFFAVVLILILHFIIFRPPRTSWLVRDLIYLSAVMLSVTVYARKILPVIAKKFVKAKIFALAVVFAVINLAAFLVLSVFLILFFDYPIQNFGGAMITSVKYGTMIGFGLSIGFNFAEFIIKRYTGVKT